MPGPTIAAGLLRLTCTNNPGGDLFTNVSIAEKSGPRDFSFRTNRQMGLLFVVLAILSSCITLRGQDRGTARPAPFTYSELTQLYENDVPSKELQTKLTQLLNNPFVSNRVGRRGVNLTANSIRVATWNIERGLEFDAIKAALTNDQQFFRQAALQWKSVDAKRLAEVLEQAKQLQQADIIVLNEVDWGLKRSGYRNIAKELAGATGMNHAYAVEFVEVDPLTLGTETLEGEVSEDREAIVKNIAVDKDRILGLHGTAILSRFRLSNIRILRFKNQGHDWYADEKKGPSRLEAGKDKAAGLVFSEKIAREVRRGNRMALLVDIENSGLPQGVVTVVATHLEDKAKPESRLKQLEELLSYIKDTAHPVILAGDMNTSGSDGRPTSFEREVKKRLGSEKFWVTQGIKYATGVGLLYDITLGVVKAKRMQSDPTVKSVRLISENPEEKFFNTLKDFRFTDGGAFDFRGAREFSVGGSNDTLSDSNERASKGFVSTFELLGKIEIELKLDWFFIKPAKLTDPDDRKQSYLFAPRFGRTLKVLNYSLKDRISDHNPLLVDLPLSEKH
jgi:endonuclease/exonuclease/phosphatase family metal-dependent hydrolase